MIKKILLGILGLIALLLIIAIFIDGHYKYEKSMNINATSSTVWSRINSLKRMNQWNPWLSLDPDLESTIEGNDGQPGAKYCWDSDKLGSGCQTIIKVMPDTLMETELLFKSWFESKAISTLRIHPDGTKVYVTWGFNSEMPYPFRIMKLFMNMDNMMEKDFTVGLNNLKAQCEPH
jgi:hypothetical protein